MIIDNNGNTSRSKSEKNIYDMIDGIPIWRHLKNGNRDAKSVTKLVSTDYGTFAEVVGKRVLNRLSEKGGILDKIFPGITIISVHRLPKFKIIEGKKIELGDLTLEVDYKDDSKFGKKIVLFEIKYGRIKIEQNQIRRYCFMINNPEDYYSSADELKVFFVIFDKIDTVNCCADYSISELNKEFAEKIIKSVPTEEWNGKFGIYDNTYSKIENAMAKLFSFS